VSLNPERLRWNLWALVATLLIGLAIGVGILSQTQLENAAFAFIPRQSYGGVVGGLVGLVALFVLYVTWKQREIALKDRQIQQLAVRQTTQRGQLLELASVMEASGQLAQKLELRPMLDLAARRVRSCLEADYSTIFLVNPRSGRLERAVSGGTAEATGEGNPGAAASAELGGGLIRHVHETGEALLVTLEEANARLARDIGLSSAPHSALCVPIRFEAARLGVLCITRTAGPEAFGPLQMRALQVLSDQCGAAIVKSFHYRRVGRDLRAAA